MARIGNAVSLAPKPKKGAVVLPYAPSSYQFTGPPPGTYNPNTLSEVEAKRHELDDFISGQETQAKYKKQALGQSRRETALGAHQNIEDQRRSLGYDSSDLGYQLSQLGINFTRDIESLSTAKIRGGEDYARTLTNMQHEYGAKAEQQSQNAIDQGTDEAGTSTASAAVRGANQAFDKSNVDTAHQRSEEDLATQQRQDEQNYATQKSHDEELGGRQQETGNIDIARAQQGNVRAQKGLTHAYQHTLQEFATAASQNTAAQGEYERHAGTSAYYEAHQLHPAIQFPGSTLPGATTQAPHTAVGLGAPALPAKGIGISRGSRLTPPRY